MKRQLIPCVAMAALFLDCSTMIEDTEHLKQLCVATSSTELLLDDGNTLIPTDVDRYGIKQGGRYKVLYTVATEQKRDKSTFTGEILDLFTIPVVPFYSDTTNITKSINPVTMNEIWVGGGFLNATVSNSLPTAGDSLHYQLMSSKETVICISLAYKCKESTSYTPSTFSCKLSDITKGKDYETLIVKVLESKNDNETVEQYYFPLLPANTTQQ